jgi:hypothetical protein
LRAKPRARGFAASHGALPRPEAYLIDSAHAGDSGAADELWALHEQRQEVQAVAKSPSPSSSPSASMGAGACAGPAAGAAAGLD